MADLERELRDLAVAWPPEPDVATAVGARIGAPPRRRLARRPALAWALVLVLCGSGGTLAASSSARSAVLELLGLKSVRVERREPAPSPGARLGLGPRVTLARARATAGFPIAVPRALGRPDAVHLDRSRGRPRVALVYRARPGRPRVLVQSLRVTAIPLIGKSAGATARVRRLQIAGAPAVFLEGAHGFEFLDERGEVGAEPQRLAGSTLLLERGGVLVRIEGDLPLASAVVVARSIE